MEPLHPDVEMKIITITWYGGDESPEIDIDGLSPYTAYGLLQYALEDAWDRVHEAEEVLGDED